MNTKEGVLKILEENRGKVVSGEEIALRLNISRNAVWKAINGLKQEGHCIEAAANKGYNLASHSDILSLAGMVPFLDTHLEVEAKINVHQRVGSTNTLAKKMAVSDAGHDRLHGTVIIADEQTEGRGRHGRPFLSLPGHGIYMSLILNPKTLGFDTPTLVTSYTAVAVCEAIEALCGKYPKIKWVNDIFLGSDDGAWQDMKKICGISAEAVMDLESRMIQWVVVGIGINFTLPGLAEMMPELVPIVGAIFEEGPPGITRNQLAAEIINRMLTPKDSPSEMLEKYRRRMFILGKKVRVEQPGAGGGGDSVPISGTASYGGAGFAVNSYEVTALDIDEIGQLVVQNDAGEITTLSAGEISIRWR